MIFAVDRLNALRKAVLHHPPLVGGLLHEARNRQPYLGFRPYLNELDKALGINTAHEYVGARLARLERRVIAMTLVR